MSTISNWKDTLGKLINKGRTIKEITTVTSQPSRLVCQKYTRKCKGAVKMCMTVLKMRITCKEKCD